VADVPDAIPLWQQIALGLGTVLTTIGLAVQQFRSGRRDEAKPAHYVMETAEIADLAAVRNLAHKLEQLLAHLALREERHAEFERRFDLAMEMIRRIDQEIEFSKRLQEDRRNREH
jgi:hypothetical protein